MTRMTIFIVKESGESDQSESGKKMPESPKSSEDKPIEQNREERAKQHPEEESGAQETTRQCEHYENASSTSSMHSSVSCTLPRKIHRSTDSLSKMALTKSDGRSRPKFFPDPRLTSNSGNDGDRSDCQWHACDKFESSDLVSGKWHSGGTTEGSIKSEGSLKSHPSHGHIYSDAEPPRSHALYKSSSSSHIPCGKHGSYQGARPLKIGGGNGEKHPSLTSLPPAYASPFSSVRNYCCCCSNASSRKTNRAESSLSLSDDMETPEGLSWRRLHMSRAKLKATATTSELLSGFAMVAMVELQINKPTAVPEWLFVLFAVCTTILVSVHIFALMISTYLLPNIDAVSKLHVSSLVTESPHDRMKSFIELAWAFSTILGLFLFLVEIAIVCWVKFWDYSFTAAISATMIVIPVLILFVAFAVHFYHSLVVIKCKSTVYDMQELENIKRQLDSVSPA